MAFNISNVDDAMVYSEVKFQMEYNHIWIIRFWWFYIKLLSRGFYFYPFTVSFRLQMLFHKQHYVDFVFISITWLNILKGTVLLYMGIMKDNYDKTNIIS